MATAPTAGYLYLIESDGDDNDDWITDHAGDPDLLDLEQYTEGTDYCKLKLPVRAKMTGNTGIVITDAGAGYSFAEKFAARGYAGTIHGIAETHTQWGYFDKFIMSDRHTSGSSATYVDYYLLYYFGTNDHAPFIDASNNQKSYCKGAVSPNYTWEWRETENTWIYITFYWRSVW